MSVDQRVRRLPNLRGRDKIERLATTALLSRHVRHFVRHITHDVQRLDWTRTHKHGRLICRLVHHQRRLHHSLPSHAGLPRRQHAAGSLAVR